MYESPIHLTIINDIARDIAKQTDENILRAVMSTGITVDKEELLKALEYDRQQYDKGFSDGVTMFITRLKETLSEHIHPTNIHDECELDLNSDEVWDIIDELGGSLNG